MPGGGKKRAKARRNRPDDAPRQIEYADEHSRYATVTTMLGNGRVMARCDDGSERQCRIRGNMRRRQWVNRGDVVLVTLREGLAGDTADLVCKYQPAEVQHLRRVGELDAADSVSEDHDDGIVFAVDDV